MLNIYFEVRIFIYIHVYPWFLHPDARVPAREYKLCKLLHLSPDLSYRTKYSLGTPALRGFLRPKGEKRPDQKNIPHQSEPSGRPLEIKKGSGHTYHSVPA